MPSLASISVVEILHLAIRTRDDSWDDKRMQCLTWREAHRACGEIEVSLLPPHRACIGYSNFVCILPRSAVKELEISHAKDDVQ